MKKERVLYFKTSAYSHEEYKELCKVLTENNILYVGYYDEYYPLEVIIRKSKKSWNDVMHLVNSIHAVKYTFKSMYFNSDGKPVEYAILHI